MKRKLTYDDLMLMILIINGLVYVVETFMFIDTHAKPVIVVASVLLAIRAFYFGDKVIQIKTLLGLSFLGSEVVMIAIPIVFLPRFIAIFFRNPKMRRLQRIAAFFFTYALLLVIATNIFDFSFFTIALWLLTFGYLPLLFIYYSTFQYDSDNGSDIFSFFEKAIKLQVIILLIQAFIHRDFSPGDSWSGSSGNAVIVGFYFCLYLLFLFLRYLIKLDRPISFFKILSVRNIMVLGLFAILMYFNDSKIVIMAFGVGGVLWLFFLLLSRFTSRLRPAMFVRLVLASGGITVIIALIYVASSIYVERSLATDKGLEALSPYTQNTLDAKGINAKYVLYKRVYVDMLHEEPIAWIFGAGPGKFGSKTSNILAYDILYRDKTQVKLPSFIPPYSSQLTKDYMADLWTEQIAGTTTERSAMLSMPFGGLITVKAEYGFIGMLFFMFLLFAFSYYLIKKAFVIDNWRFKDWAIAMSIAWFSLPLHMIFDNYQDKGYFMLPLLTLSAVLLSLVEEKKVIPV